MNHRSLVIFVTLVVTLLTVQIAASQQSYSVSIFRDRDSLTIYIPGNQPVGLGGFAFEVANHAGQRVTYRLEQYAGFMGLSYSAIPTPICFRLVRQNTAPTLTQVCQEISVNRVLSHTLQDADVFWYDSVSNQQLVLAVIRSDFAEICPANIARCDLLLPTLPTSTPLPATATPESTATFTPLPPTPTPDFSGEIAFTSNRDGNYEIYLMNADGTNVRRLTNHWASDGGAAWSPDGTQIAFTSDRDGNTEIYIMNADGTNPHRITDNSAVDTNPIWSPDGTRIAFTSERDGNAEIYVMTTDGSNLRRLTNNLALDGASSWSPFGTQLLFSSDRDGNTEIYMMNVDGSNQRNLTNNSAKDGAADWSPDGKKILFISDRETAFSITGTIGVFVMDLDGFSFASILTDGWTNAYNPDWSPDGKKIVYNAFSKNNFEIYVMNANGSDERQLTENAAEDSYPVWRP